MKTMHPVVAVAVALLMSAPLALAQNASGNTQSGNSKLSSADKTFLDQDARGVAYELQISKMAAQKATNQNVRKYAEMVVNDHEKYNPELHKVAEQNGLTLPTSPDQEQQNRIDHLQKLNGTAFDQAYVQDVKQDNERDVNEDQKEINSTQNQQVKQFVEQFQQMDQKHTQDAKNLQASGSSNG